MVRSGRCGDRLVSRESDPGVGDDRADVPMCLPEDQKMAAHCHVCHADYVMCFHVLLHVISTQSETQRPCGLAFAVVKLIPSRSYTSLMSYCLRMPRSSRMIVASSAVVRCRCRWISVSIIVWSLNCPHFPIPTTAELNGFLKRSPTTHGRFVVHQITVISPTLLSLVVIYRPPGSPT